MHRPACFEDCILQPPEGQRGPLFERWRTIRALRRFRPTDRAGRPYGSGGDLPGPFMRINPPLIALAIGAFGIGVSEFAPMGLLPVIANDLHASIPAAGLLISAYALGVVIGAPLMTLTTGRIPRRTLLIGLAGIFTI